MTINLNNITLDTKQSPAWLQTLRAEALAEFKAQGLPTPKAENWKYTNLAPLTANEFVVSSPDVQLQNSQLPKGVIFTNMATALQQYPDLIQQHLGLVDKSQSLNNLNLALMTDGFFLYVPSNIILTEPLHIVFAANSTNGASMQQSRNLILAGAKAQATLVIEYVGIEANNYWHNRVTQVVAEEHAKINIYQLQREHTSAFHIGLTHVRQAANSQFNMTSIALGGRLARDEINIELNGSGAECQLQGVYLANQTQHLDQRIRIEHKAMHTQSQQWYKGIATDKSSTIFNGKIKVDKGAQSIVARQINPNLLLASTATVNTKPELEIYADNVQCNHGATVGELDDTALFYLQSRGISKQQARIMLTEAFAGEILDLISSTDIKNYLAKPVYEKLSTMANTETRT